MNTAGASRSDGGWGADSDLPLFAAAKASSAPPADGDAGVREEMRTLAARLNAAADAYYGGRGELMTDFEWDALFDRLKALEEKSGTVLPESPTNRVSSDDVAGRKEPHEFPALSLAKTKKTDELAKWADGRPVWISWKLDGLTLVATYDGGVLSKLVTRGDGHVGTNITHLAGGIQGVPRKIQHKGHLVVRGEAVISYADFNEFVAQSQEDYANPRNLAAGSLVLKDAEELRQRNLRWIAFTLVHCDRDIVSWGERMDFLESLGFAAVEREYVPDPSPEEVAAAIGRWTDKVTSGGQPFPVDGLVVAYDDTGYAKTGSVTGHHATRAGLAFKWADESAATVLETVEWSCAVASISPVAVFRPVQLEGTTVRRASLCNISECERLGIGGPGTEITVIKANKIIPKVVGVVKKSGEFAPPAACPVCGAATEIRQSQSGTRVLKCTNASCAARELRKFMRFVSRECMDIGGLAGETLAKFVNRGWIRTFADIYRLGRHRAEIAAMDGFGEKSAENICASVEAARRRGAVRFLVALSIPLCGPDVAKRLLGEYSLRGLFDAARDGGGAFAAIDGIGPVKSAAFAKWCSEPANMAAVEDLLGEIEIEEHVAAPKTGICAGKVFVITGETRRFRNRAAFKEYVESAGGKTAGAVSKATDFLVNNDAASQSSKNRKAKELGIPVITEDEFLERFGPDAAGGQA